MNANLSIATSGALVSRAAERVQRSGTATRVWYLATSALTGAVLSMAVAWPGAHPAIERIPLSQNPIAAAPPSPEPAAARTEPTGAIGGTAVLEAVRAAGAASEMLVLARGSRGGTALSVGAVASNPARAGVSNPIGPAASAGPAVGSTIVSASGPVTVDTAGSVAGQSSFASGPGGRSVDTRQPPAAPGPNRIAIPGAPEQSPPSTAGAPASAGPGSLSGSNRITLPVTPSPH